MDIVILARASAQHGTTPPGYTRTRKGHLQFRRRGPRYGRYLHREVFLALLAETHPLTLAVMQPPEHYDVHHVDGNGAHNCPENLLAIDKRIHTFFTSWAERYAYRVRRSFLQDLPEWVTHAWPADDEAHWSA